MNKYLQLHLDPNGYEENKMAGYSHIGNIHWYGGLGRLA